jgi:hypothetical protein
VKKILGIATAAGILSVGLSLSPAAFASTDPLFTNTWDKSSIGPNESATSSNSITLSNSNTTDFWICETVDNVYTLPSRTCLERRTNGEIAMTRTYAQLRQLNLPGQSREFLFGFHIFALSDVNRSTGRPNLGAVPFSANNITILADNDAPSLTSSSSFTVAPGSTNIGTLTASEPVKWTMLGTSGTNADVLRVNSTTGAVTFAPAQSTPGTYVADVRFTDAAGNATTVRISVIVEAADTTAPVISTGNLNPSVVQGSTAVTTLTAN